MGATGQQWYAQLSEARDHPLQVASHSLHAAAYLGLDGGATTGTLLAAVAHALRVLAEREGTLTNETNHGGGRGAGRPSRRCSPATPARTTLQRHQVRVLPSRTSSPFPSGVKAAVGIGTGCPQPKKRVSPEVSAAGNFTSRRASRSAKRRP